MRFFFCIYLACCLQASWICSLVFGVIISHYCFKYCLHPFLALKAECRRIDAFELWCWRRLLRVPWTARRSNQSILKISPACSLEGLMLKLKLQYFGHLITRWKRPWCWEGLGAGGEGDNRGWDGWMASPTQWTWVWVNSKSWWWTGRPGVLWFMGLQRVGHNWATELILIICYIFSVFPRLPGSSDGKESACNAGDWGLVPGSGRPSGGEDGNPLQHSCLESPNGQRSLAGYISWDPKALTWLSNYHLIHAALGYFVLFFS